MPPEGAARWAYGSRRLAHFRRGALARRTGPLPAILLVAGCGSVRNRLGRQRLEIGERAPEGNLRQP